MDDRAYLSPLQVAALFDQQDAFELLRARSSHRDRFLTACARARADEAAALLRESPGMVGELGDDMRFLADAAWRSNPAAVDLMLSLGFDPAVEGTEGGTVLHCAAWQGSAACVDVALRYDRVRALIDVRDRVHDSTPLGWCCHGSSYARKTNDYPEIARRLLEAGAQPGPNLQHATDDVRAVIREHEPWGGSSMGRLTENEPATAKTKAKPARKKR
jgi:hypothetical protein